jgi:hypothetical protein
MMAKNWHRDLQAEFLGYTEEDEMPDKYADNGVGITARAHAIMDYASDLEDVVETLRAVNMDRLANRVAGIQKMVIATARPISGIVGKELNESIAHGQHMMGGLLMLVLSGKLTG